SAGTGLDPAAALLLWRAWGPRRAPQLVLRPEHESLFDDLVKERELPTPRLEWWATTIALGQKALSLLGHAGGGIAALGQVTIDAAGLGGRPLPIPRRGVSA